MSRRSSTNLRCSGWGWLVDALGLIPAETRRPLIQALAGYAAAARERGADRIAFVGTEPLRRAADARAVVVAVEDATGVPFHVVDSREEGLLTLIGATSGRVIPADLLVVDVGGGQHAMLVVVAGPPGGRDRARRRWCAVDGGPRDPRSADAAARSPRSGLPHGLRSGRPGRRAGGDRGVGGTASNLVKIVPAALDDRILTPDRLATAFETLCGAPAADVAARFGIRPERARILAAGAAILEAILARYGVTRATASEEGVREGTVLALARAGAGWRDRLEALAHGWGANGAADLADRPEPPSGGSTGVIAER